MGSLFHFLRYGFVCCSYFPARNPPGSVLSPFQGLRLYLYKQSCERRPFSGFITSYEFTSVSGSNELSPLFLVQ